MAVDISFGKVRGGAMAQMHAVLVEQQHGASDADKLRFDQPRQAVQDFGKRRVGRDHFEDVRLPVAQRLGEFARGDVARDAHEADDPVIRRKAAP